MKKVIKFDSEKEFKAYMKSKTVSEIGDGSEGVCYLGKDGKAYKSFQDGYIKSTYQVDEIITSDEASTNSFLFPDILFTINDIVVGYVCKFIPRDDLNFNKLIFEGLDHINFDKLYDAYSPLRNDAVVLAQNGISIFDLSYNLMFDGQSLYGIDTCSYTRKPGDLTDSNLAYVDAAMKDPFCLYFKEEYDIDLDKDMEVKPFLKMVKKKYKEVAKDTPAQYAKKY